MSENRKKILVYGAGAIGSTVAGWLAENGEDVTVLARGENASAIKSNGLLIYRIRHKEESRPVAVKVITQMDEMPVPDIIILSVKNYDLEDAAQDIRQHITTKPLDITLQNGMENQKILPKYFEMIVYGVICYNAWRDAPGVFGYRTRGTLLFWILDPSVKQELETLISRMLRPAFHCEITDRLTDAVQCKIVLNLLNSVTALIGQGVREINDRELLRKIMMGILSEGIGVLQAAGVKEVRLGHIQSWKMVKLGTKLPSFIAQRIFEKNFKKAQMSSMAQDVLVMNKSTTELDSINGYIVELAKRVGFKAKLNQAIYEVAESEFGKPDFQHLEVADLWGKMKERMR